MINYLRVLLGLTLLIGCSSNEMVTENSVCSLGDSRITPLGNAVTFNIGTWNASTIETSDNNFVTVGSRYCIDSTKMVFIETDSNGNEICRNIFSNLNSNTSIAQAVCEGENGSFYLVGYSYDEANNSDPILTVGKLSSEGQVVWLKTYGTNSEIIGKHIAFVDSKNIIVTGSTDNNGIVLLKIDADGKEIFFDILNRSSKYTLSGMLLLQDGNILFTGTENWKINLFCISIDGIKLWEQNYSSNFSRGRSTIQLSNGDLLTVGSFLFGRMNTEFSLSLDSSFIHLVKTNPIGQLIWESKHGEGGSSDDGQSVAENEGGGFVITGYNTNDLNSKPFLSYVDDEGKMISNIHYFDITGRGQNILKTNDDRNFITAGGCHFINVDNFGMK